MDSGNRKKKSNEAGIDSYAIVTKVVFGCMRIEPLYISQFLDMRIE